jgi:hypothetical protein
LPVINPALARADETLRPEFSASWDGSLWKLTWDSVAVEALHPAAAVLSIRDGGTQRRINLAPSELTSGTIFYPPQSENLLFSLNIVMRGGQTAEEHVRVMEGPRIVEAPAESIAKIQEGGQGRPSQQFPLTPERPSPFPSQPTAKRPALQAAKRTLAASAHQSTFHVYSPSKPFPAQKPSPANTKGRTPGPALPAPPVIGRSGPDTSERLPFPATACCTATATYEPASPSGFQRVIHKVPVLRRLSASRAGLGKGFIAPRPLHEIQFTLPRDASPVLMDKKRMDLKASVDASGRVIRVKMLSPRDGDLERLAAYAADAWRFEPAELNEQPVPGEVILHFNFDTGSMAQTVIDESKGR